MTDRDLARVRELEAECEQWAEASRGLLEVNDSLKDIAAAYREIGEAWQARVDAPCDFRLTNSPLRGLLDRAAEHAKGTSRG